MTYLEDIQQRKGIYEGSKIYISYLYWVSEGSEKFYQVTRLPVINVSQKQKELRRRWYIYLHVEVLPSVRMEMSVYLSYLKGKLGSRKIFPRMKVHTIKYLKIAMICSVISFVELIIGSIKSSFCCRRWPSFSP